MSVSNILVYAVKKYLYEILFSPKPDNYVLKDYIIVCQLKNDVICWKLYWENPGIKNL